MPPDQTLSGRLTHGHSQIGNFSSVTWHLANVKREAVAGRRQGAGYTLMNGKLYIFGGWMSSNRISNDVVCLSQAPDGRLVWNWVSTTQGERPQPVYGCTISAVTSQTHGECLVTHGGVIWGGYQGAVSHHWNASRLLYFFFFLTAPIFDTVL